MRVTSTIASRTSAGLAALGLAGTLAIAGLIGAPAAAWADEEATKAAGLTPISQGVCDALWVVTHDTDQHGQDMQTEAVLAKARQDDAAAEEEAIFNMNTRGERHKLLMAAGIEQERQEQEAEAAAEELNARAQAQADGEEAIDDDRIPMAFAPAAKDTENAPAAQNPGTITMLGKEVAFAQGSCFDSTAPDGYASTWLGDGDVTDGTNTYFIGHNPGVFAPVMDLQIGDTVTVCDEAGNSRTYTVYDTIILPKRSNYFEFEDRIAPLCESVTLQTCCPGDATVRCVMAR